MYRYIIPFIFVFFLTSFTHAEQLTADQILKYVDEIKSPQKDYSVSARIISKKPNKEDKVAVYEILMKGQDKTIIKTLKPDMDKGTTLLMLDYDLWVFLQNISKPLRISLQQRLFGEASNGDIARANFSNDYNPEINSIVQIKGRDFYVLDLKAKDDRVTYNQVKIWVMKDTYYPLKAQFYAVSGKLLKTCYYANYKKILGKRRPTRLVLHDPLIKGKNTIIDYYNMKLEDFPDKMFSKNYLKKMVY